MVKAVGRVFALGITMNKEQLDKELHVIASEIEGLMLSGKVKAIAAIVYTDDGLFHTRIRFIEKGRMPLLAGVTLLQADVLEMIRDNVKGE